LQSALADFLKAMLLRLSIACLAPWEQFKNLGNLNVMVKSEHRMLIRKPLEQDKADAASSQKHQKKHFAPRQATFQMRRALPNEKPASGKHTNVKF
jgi:hypothetical protein